VYNNRIPSVLVPSHRNGENAMPFIPAVNTAQLELNYIWDGQFCQTVLHYLKATAWDTTDLSELVQEAIDQWSTNFPTSMPSSLALISVRGTDLSSATGPTVVSSAGLPEPGVSGSPSLPNNCAMVVTKRTDQRGRSFRGRIYHPGLTEATVTGNTVNSASVTAILGLWSNFLTLAITADEGVLSIVSRYTNGAPRATALVTTVSTLTSDGIVDSQRRRLPGRGG
jgi:hypothetical protein